MESQHLNEVCKRLQIGDLDDLKSSGSRLTTSGIVWNRLTHRQFRFSGKF